MVSPEMSTLAFLAGIVGAIEYFGVVFLAAVFLKAVFCVAFFLADEDAV